MTCYCGATDCPSCGPAQGYKVIKVRNKRGGYIYINPEDDEECISEDEYISKLHNKIWEDEI